MVARSVFKRGDTGFEPVKIALPSRIGRHVPKYFLHDAGAFPEGGATAAAAAAWGSLLVPAGGALAPLGSDVHAFDAR